MFFDNAMLEIALVSLAMVFVSQILQNKFMNRKVMKENQDKIKEKQKRLQELTGKEDSRSKTEADKLQKEMLETMGQSMQGTMRHMMFSLPIFLAVFWFLGVNYGGIIIQLPVAVPIIHRNFSFEITSSISWLWWYIYCSFILGLVLSTGLRMIRK